MLQAGDLYRVNDRVDVARKLYDDVIAMDDAHGVVDWRVLFARSSVRSEAGDWQVAEADLQAAIAVEPDRPELLNFLGYASVDRRRARAGGLALIQRAADARPDQGISSTVSAGPISGWARWRRRSTYLERAAELSPTDSEVIDHLGDAYWRAGRETEARFEWTAALDLKPDAVRRGNIAEQARQGLASGGGSQSELRGHEFESEPREFLDCLGACQGEPVPACRLARRWRAAPAGQPGRVRGHAGGGSHFG